MKVVQINATCGVGSTGKICTAVSDLLTQKGVQNHIFYASGASEHPAGIQYMKPWEVKLQALRSRVLGNYGFNSKRATKRLISQLERLRPDIVHLHNLHGYNCDLRALFSYLRERKIKVYWTFHDCWAFTAYCPHFDKIGCDQWKTKCEKCPQRKRYSWLLDRSSQLFEKKKELTTGLDLTIITPSQWLADLVRESFLYKYPTRVIHNGIDLSVFQPTDSDLRKQYHCEDKFVILGVAFGWHDGKGLDVFCELAQRLPDRFQIVLVGTNEAVDRQLPRNIISIHRTANQMELAKIYTAADLLVNPTREENYPTVHMEAIACGTPVLTFRTGGCTEMLDEDCGYSVEKNDTEELYRQILQICATGADHKAACLKQAQKFDRNTCFEQYVSLYED